MRKFWSVFSITLSSCCFATDTDVLTIDRTVPGDLELAFPNDKGVKPQSSDFELLHYVLMSNDLGERWAVVTVKNLSTGGRLFENQHLLALFANGDRQDPHEFQMDFKGNETRSMTVSFGQSKFPILSVITQTSK